jgi:hypothetical protein
MIPTEAYRELRLTVNDTTAVEGVTGIAFAEPASIVQIDTYNFAQFVTRRGLRDLWGMSLPDLLRHFRGIESTYVRKNKGVLLARKAPEVMRNHENGHALADQINPEILGYFEELILKVRGGVKLRGIPTSLKRIPGANLALLTDDDYQKHAAYISLSEGVAEWIAYECKAKKQGVTEDDSYQFHRSIAKSHLMGKGSPPLWYSLGHTFVNDVLDGLRREYGRNTAEGLTLLLHNPPALHDDLYQGMYFYKKIADK